ncbi:MAG: DUF167 domain-containing protein [Candidatus Nanoarchaeia archaeon]|nr:DUF167 domain-containing protein [Candidatus Nanoarchaeia archaeon]MDD5239571.1 DUF167 domain-containing protein [Candidatus Nanoarchaeia archaeon]
MKLNVRAIPNASMNLVETQLNGSLKVKLTAVPQKGKANAMLTEVLAKHYNVKKSKVHVLKGATSKDKLVEVEL